MMQSMIRWGVLALLALFWTASAQAALPSKARASLQRCVSFYKQSKWASAIKSCQTAWDESERRPRFERQPIRLYTGMALYRMGRKALAWKAFEDLLLYDPHVMIQSSEPADLRLFFEKVKKRVVKRTGISLKQLPPLSNKAGTPQWLVPGILLGVGLAFVTGGALLMANSGQSQGQFNSLSQQATTSGVQQGQLDSTLTPLRDGASLEGTLGIVSLGVGGASIVGGIVMLVLSKPNNS